MAGRPGRLRSMTPARLALRPRPRGGRVRPIGTGPAGRTHGLGALGTLPGRLREGVACDAGSALFAACLEGRRRSSAGVAGLPSRRVLARERRLRRLDNGPALDEKAPGVHPRGQRQGGGPNEPGRHVIVREALIHPSDRRRSDLKLISVRPVDLYSTGDQIDGDVSSIKYREPLEVSVQAPAAGNLRRRVRQILQEPSSHPGTLSNPTPSAHRHESDFELRHGTVSAGQERCPGGGAEGTRTPDLLIAKASLGAVSLSGPVRTRAFDGLHVQYADSGVRAGCALLDGQERATDPIASPLARRCPGSRVAGGHRIATRSALDAGRRRAHRRRSGRRLGGDRRGGP